LQHYAALEVDTDISQEDISFTLRFDNEDGSTTLLRNYYTVSQLTRPRSVHNLVTKHDGDLMKDDDIYTTSSTWPHITLVRKSERKRTLGRKV
jgi:hypothetical protein